MTEEKNKGGRPRRHYTEQQIDDICEAVSAGRFLKYVLADMGIPERTFHGEMARNEALAMRITAAREAVLNGYVEIGNELSKAGKSTKWQEYQLTKRFPTEFGDVSKVQLSGPDDGPIEFAGTMPRTTAEALERIEQLKRELERKGGE